MANKHLKDPFEPDRYMNREIGQLVRDHGLANFLAAVAEQVKIEKADTDAEVAAYRDLDRIQTLILVAEGIAREGEQ